MAFSRALHKLPTCHSNYIFRKHLYAFRIMFFGHLRSIKGTSPPIFTVSLSPFSLSLSLSLHYPKFRTPQILSKFGVLLLKRTAFQPLSNIMEGKFDFCTHAWLIWLIFFFGILVGCNPDFVFRSRLLLSGF